MPSLSQLGGHCQRFGCCKPISLLAHAGVPRRCSLQRGARAGRVAQRGARLRLAHQAARPVLRARRLRSQRILQRACRVALRRLESVQGPGKPHTQPHCPARTPSRVAARTSCTRTAERLLNSRCRPRGACVSSACVNRAAAAAAAPRAAAALPCTRSCGGAAARISARRCAEGTAAALVETLASSRDARARATPGGAVASRTPSDTTAPCHEPGRTSSACRTAWVPSPPTHCRSMRCASCAGVAMYEICSSAGSSTRLGPLPHLPRQPVRSTVTPGGASSRAASAMFKLPWCRHVLRGAACPATSSCVRRHRGASAQNVRSGAPRTCWCKF
jgi:hypothetical protein